MSSQVLIEKQEDEEVEYGGWKAMIYVIGNETCERLGTLGTSSNLLVYLTTIFHLSNVQATLLINVWNGTTNAATIVGAFFSDAYFGRYAVLGFASVASFTGMTVLALTAAVGTLHPRRCDGGAAFCPGPTRWQLAFLLFGLGLLVVGAGGIRPCNLAFGADQFDPRTAAGQRSIASFFNIYYVTYIVAMLIAATAIVYVQSSISWAVGLSIPAALMVMACIFFFCGSSIYVKVAPEGSPCIGIARVIVAAARNRRLKLPRSSAFVAASLSDPPPATDAINARLPHTNQFRFLDKAAIIAINGELDTEGSSLANPWRLSSLQQVEEAKCLLRVVPVWLSGTIFSLGVTQQTTFSVLQALQSDRRLLGTNFDIPAASFPLISMVVLVLWLPFYDRVLVPWLRHITGKEDGLTLLQRIGTGFAISMIATATSAMVEQRRKRACAAAPMSAFWLAAQLGLSGLAEAFATIGQVEFYYKQLPENMRSIGGSFVYLAIAVASYLSSFLVTIIHHLSGWLTDDLNQGNLDRFYLLVASLEAINLLCFLAISRWYMYKGSSTQID